MNDPKAETIERVARYTGTQSDNWRSLLQSLVRIRSVYESEHAIVDLVASRIAALGATPERVVHDAARLAALPAAQRPFSAVADRASLVARIAGSGGGRSLALNVHLDIVSEGDAAAWTRPPFGAEIDDERRTIHGRGTMDDKAGVAIALAVLETLTRTDARLRGDVLFHFVLEDETTGNGSLLCLDAGHRADAVVIIDGTRPDRAIDRHAGQLQFDVRVTGRPAAVGVSHLGVNAADALARLVARLADRVAALNARRDEPWTRFPSPYQLVTQRLSADASPLTVPDLATATCYATFPPPWTIADMQRFLADAVQEFAQERGLSPVPSLEFAGMCAEPVAVASGELAGLLQICATAAGYGPIDVGPSTGTSDMRHFAAAGIPCLLYGPGTGFNPHRADEYYHLDDLEGMVRLFTRLAMEWCGVG
jgi:acetylornithine deacetylase